MDERDMREFSWPGLFLVTGTCFFIFSLLLKFLSGSYPGIFIWIGIISLSLGILCWLGKSIPYADSKKKQKITS
jgi:membrane protein required for beta-lactamase induction